MHLRLIIVALLTLAGASAGAQGANSAVPDTVEYASGELRLRGLVYRPAGSGTHPAVLFLHGSGDTYDQQAAVIGPFYAATGYVLFMPFRRGQGLSAGRGEAIVPRLDREGEAHGAEARGRLMARLLETEQLDDVRAALAYLRARPDVDSARVVVAGNSFGGILSVFSAAWAPGVRAAIASAAAAQSWAGAPALRERLRAAAREARVPIFFFQAANDYDLSPSRELAAEMVTAGRPHALTVYPAYGASVEEGHSFGYFGGVTWGPDVLAFLERALGGPASAFAPMPSIILPDGLDRVLRDYEHAWRAGDAEALAQLFTPDGFVLATGEPPVRGRASIRRAYQGQRGSLVLRALAFATADTVGYIIGAYRYEPATGDQGKFTLTLRRGPRRRWFIASDMDSPIRQARREPAAPGAPADRPSN